VPTLIQGQRLTSETLSLPIFTILACDEHTVGPVSSDIPQFRRPNETGRSRSNSTELPSKPKSLPGGLKSLEGRGCRTPKGVYCTVVCFFAPAKSVCAVPDPICPFLHGWPTSTPSTCPSIAQTRRHSQFERGIRHRTRDGANNQGLSLSGFHTPAGMCGTIPPAACLRRHAHVRIVSATTDDSCRLAVTGGVAEQGRIRVPVCLR